MRIAGRVRDPPADLRPHLCREPRDLRLCEWPLVYRRVDDGERARVSAKPLRDPGRYGPWRGAAGLDIENVGPWIGRFDIDPQDRSAPGQLGGLSRLRAGGVRRDDLTSRKRAGQDRVVDQVRPCSPWLLRGLSRRCRTPSRPGRVCGRRAGGRRAGSPRDGRGLVAVSAFLAVLLMSPDSGGLPGDAAGGGSSERTCGMVLRWSGCRNGYPGRDSADDDGRRRRYRECEAGRLAPTLVARDAVARRTTVLWGTAVSGHDGPWSGAGALSCDPGCSRRAAKEPPAQQYADATRIRATRRREGDNHTPRYCRSLPVDA